MTERRQQRERREREGARMTSRFRASPYPEGHVFLTDGGLETTLGFLEGLEMPATAAYGLLRSKEGRRALEDYYVSYAELGRSHRIGMVLDTPTRRANPGWGHVLGDDEAALDRFNERAVALLLDVRARYSSRAHPIVISGAVGGHSPSAGMSASAAAAHHSPQVRQLAKAGVDVITARGMTGSSEAIGIADAAAAHHVPCTVSFTIEPDGSLPDSEPLSAAIAAVDDATGGSVHSFMIDCAPVASVASLLDTASGEWLERLIGVRAHGSTSMHRGLVQTSADQSGDPETFGLALADRRRHSPQLVVVGGCCGTDERHLEAVALCVQD